MKFDSDDALDRALFALPLEEPPPALRASILAATAWRDPPVVSVPEGIALAAIAAALAWIAVLLIPQLGASTANAFSDPSTLLWLPWLGLGTSVTIGATLFTESQSRRTAAKAGNAARRA